MMKKRHLSIFGWNKKRLSEKKSKRSSKELKPTLKQLHDAIYEEKIAQVKQIIELDAELINQKKNARTALHIAARSGNSEMVELLLAHGANPNIADDAGWTGIHCAAFSGNLKTIEALIKDKNVNLAVKNADENTALHYIARHCNDVPDSTLNEFIKSGFDVNTPNSSGETPLHNACWKGNIRITEWLLKNKANTEIRTEKQETPLHWAARAGQTKIAEMLIAAGASLTASGIEGTPYEVAVPIDKLKKMLKVDPSVVVIKVTPESNTNNTNSLAVGRRDIKSNSMGSAEDGTKILGKPLDEITSAGSTKNLLNSPIKAIPPLSPTSARARSSSFSKASHRLYLKDELSANPKSDSQIKSEGQMRARLEAELIDELVDFCKTNSLLAIISKVLESRSWTWSEKYEENKIEMLKWICEFVEKDKKYQYLEYLYMKYKDKIKIEIRDTDDFSSDSDEQLTSASVDSLDTSDALTSSPGTSFSSADDGYMRKPRRLTLREKKLTPYSWELDLNECIASEVIGQGGFGLVYRGTYKNEEVAIKQLKTDELGEDDMMAFLKEISIMSSLKHENILKFKGATIVDVVCLVTEYAHKGDLRTYMLKNNVDQIRKLDFALQIAKAVNYLHSQDPPIVHRDLKCSNILVDKDDCIKVSDFGLSKHASSGGNTRMGTLNWIAPEILRNAGPFTEKADVFSYGIVVWEIFTNGQVPYQGLQPLQIVRAIDEGVRPEIPNTVEERTKKLIEQCWGEDPEQRPSFVQIISTLENIIKNTRQ